MNTIDLLRTKVESVMTRELKTVGLKANMFRVEEIMSDLGVHHVPVVDDDQNFAGIISKVDLERLLHWDKRNNLAGTEKNNIQVFSSMLAEEVMVKSAVTVSPDNTLEYCSDVFKQNYFHALPVVQDNKLVGLITTYDLINEAYNLKSVGIQS